ncbi:signal peptidase II [Candidatus Woesearchaeota archaeon]|nr:MAG: signal peptidase II [Candidatus Woesearchaeota archaeon]
MRLTPRAFLPYAGLFIGIIALDQAVKNVSRGLALGERHTLIPKLLAFTHVQNTGITFGFLQGSNGAVIWLSIFFLGILVYFFDYFSTRTERVLYTLLLAGIIGNLIDRLAQGFVTDVFDLTGWPGIFNVADSALVIGVCGMLLHEIYTSTHGKRAAPAVPRRSSP